MTRKMRKRMKKRNLMAVEKPHLNLQNQLRDQHHSLQSQKQSQHQSQKQGPVQMVHQVHHPHQCQLFQSHPILNLNLHLQKKKSQKMMAKNQHHHNHRQIPILSLQSSQHRSHQRRNLQQEVNRLLDQDQKDQVPKVQLHPSQRMSLKLEVVPQLHDLNLVLLRDLDLDLRLRIQKMVIQMLKKLKRLPRRPKKRPKKLKRKQSKKKS